VNTLKIGVEEAREFTAERGYELEPVKGIEEAFCLRQPETSGSTLEFFLGYYHIQGLTSMFPAKILDPQPGRSSSTFVRLPEGRPRIWLR